MAFNKKIGYGAMFDNKYKESEEDRKPHRTGYLVLATTVEAGQEIKIDEWIAKDANGNPKHVLKHNTYQNPEGQRNVERVRQLVKDVFPDSGGDESREREGQDYPPPDAYDLPF